MVDSLLGTMIILLKNSPSEAMRIRFENTGVQDELKFNLASGKYQ